MQLRLVDDLWRDFDRLARMGLRPSALMLDAGAWAVTTYRVGRALPRALQPLHRPVQAVVRALTRVSLPLDADLGGGLQVARGVRVAPRVRIGRDCNLGRGATVDAEGALLGDRVYLGPGACVADNVRLGNDAAVGAAAVVREDVPDRGVVGSSSNVLELRRRPVPGRRRPPLAEQVRSLLRDVLPRPAQLLITG